MPILAPTLGSLLADCGISLEVTCKPVPEVRNGRRCDREARLSAFEVGPDNTKDTSDDAHIVEGMSVILLEVAIAAVVLAMVRRNRGIINEEEI